MTRRARRAIIAGAGVFGTCIAVEFVDRGWSVDVLDRREPDSASTADARVLRVSHGPYDWYASSAARGIAGWHRIERRTGSQLIEARGVVLFVSEGNDGDWEQHSLACLARLGIHAEKLDPRATARRFPHVDVTGLEFAVWEPGAGVIRARQALGSLHGLLASLGTDIDYADCAPQGDGQLRVNDDIMSADAVIWATGPHTPSLFPGLTPIRPARQDSFYLAGQGELSDGPAWLDTGRRLYGVPAGAGRYAKVVADVEEDLDAPITSPPALPELLAGYLQRRFPRQDQTVTRRQACRYAGTPDDNFVLGRHPGHDRTWIVGGDSGVGFKHAPAWASYTADAVEGSRQPHSRFSLRRPAAHEGMPSPATQPRPAPPLTVGGPHGLAGCARHFTPGTVLRVDGQPGQILGAVVAVDHVETWIECYITLGDQHRWLAVEAPDGNVRYTVWQRDTAARSGLDMTTATLRGIQLIPTHHGTARYSATGVFGTTAIARNGVIDYVEYTCRTGRVAAARFGAGEPWLVGTGSGESVTVEPMG